jgi:hypothetical protein
MSQRYQLNANGPERPQVLANLHAFVDRLPANKSWRIEIKEARKERSGDQNAALWGVAYPALSNATGYDPDELHDAFCRKFFGEVARTVMGQTMSRPARTTTTNEQGDRDVIDAATFARFYDMVQRIGAEAGIDVPSPDPMHGQRDRWAA